MVWSYGRPVEVVVGVARARAVGARPVVIVREAPAGLLPAVEAGRDELAPRPERQGELEVAVEVGAAAAVGVAEQRRLRAVLDRPVERGPGHAQRSAEADLDLVARRVGVVRQRLVRGEVGLVGLLRGVGRERAAAERPLGVDPLVGVLDPPLGVERVGVLPEERARAVVEGCPEVVQARRRDARVEVDLVAVPVALLGDDVDDAGLRLAVLGVVATGHDLELLDGREVDPRVGVVVERVAAARAVDEEGDLVERPAADGDLAVVDVDGGERGEDLRELGRGPRLDLLGAEARRAWSCCRARRAGARP